ncbi:MAG: GAF domain-containing sensor histidine kinase [bacterium]
MTENDISKYQEKISQLEGRLKEADSRIAELKTLVDVTKMVGSTLNLNTLLGLAMRLTTQVMKAEASSLMLIDEKTEELEFKVTYGDKKEEIKKFKLPLGKGIAGTVAQQGQPILVADAQNDPRFDKSMDKKTGFNTKSIICVPLKVRDNIIGVIEVINKKSADSFTRDDVILCGAFASQVAMAVSNARLYEDLQQLARVKSEFMSIISHELRTPLMIIIGALELLRDVDNLDEQKREEFISIVSRECDKFGRLITDLLTVADLESGEMKLDRKILDIGKIAADVIKKENIDTKQFTLHIKTPPDAVLVSIDEEKISHVFKHLIENAVKFSTSGGNITFSIEEKEKEIECSISDTGIGIECEHCEQIFDRFFQVDSSDTRKAGGTGTGLYLAKQIVQAHGGSISVHSTPGKGTTFTLRLPLEV